MSVLASPTTGPGFAPAGAARTGATASGRAARVTVTHPSRLRAWQWLKDRSVFTKILLGGLAATTLAMALGLSTTAWQLHRLVTAIEVRNATGRMLLRWQDVRAARQRFPLRALAEGHAAAARDELLESLEDVLARIQQEHDTVVAARDGSLTRDLGLGQPLGQHIATFDAELRAVVGALGETLSPAELSALEAPGSAANQAAARIEATLLAARDHAGQHVRDSVGRFLAAAALGFLVATAAALGILSIFARSLSLRLHRIEAAAVRVGQGDLSTRVEIDAADELGRLEESLNETAKRLASQTVYLNRVVRTLGDPVLVLDPSSRAEARDATIRMANPAALKLLGYSEEELVGQPISLIVPQHPSVDVRDVGDDERLLSGDIDVVGKDGHRFPVSFALTLLRDVDGQPQAVVCSAQDITERRLVEQRKSDFVAFTSHQLRTPLTAIKWMLELASRPDASRDDVASALADARASADRLMGLVNDLLEVSRLESGRLKVVLETIDVEELTRSVAAELAPTIAERSLALSIAVDGVLRPVRADRTLLRQVMDDLIGNAIEFTPAGGAIDVSLAMAGERLRWSVRDTGIGIPKGDLERLFGKFVRADNALRTETEGTGLGLYMVKLIVERFGGTVSCASQLGQGSTFTFELESGE